MYGTIGKDSRSVPTFVKIINIRTKLQLGFLCLAVLSVSEKIHRDFGCNNEGRARLREEGSFQNLLEFVSINEKDEEDALYVDSLIFDLMLYKSNPVAIIAFLEKTKMDVPPSIMQLVA